MGLPMRMGLSAAPKPLNAWDVPDDEGHQVVEERHLNDRPGFRLSLTYWLSL